MISCVTRFCCYLWVVIKMLLCKKQYTDCRSLNLNKSYSYHSMFWGPKYKPFVFYTDKCLLLHIIFERHMKVKLVQFKTLLYKNPQDNERNGLNSWLYQVLDSHLSDNVTGSAAMTTTKPLCRQHYMLSVQLTRKISH